MGIIRYILERGTERSTWLGLVTILGLFGIVLGDGVVQIIATGLVGLCGTVLALMNELRLFPGTEQPPAENDEEPPTGI